MVINVDHPLNSTIKSPHSPPSANVSYNEYYKTCTFLFTLELYRSNVSFSQSAVTHLMKSAKERSVGQNLIKEGKRSDQLGLT